MLTNKFKCNNSGPSLWAPLTTNCAASLGNKMQKNVLFFSLMINGWSSPPLKSTGRSVGGGSRSPAGSADASTASPSALCPEGAAWSQTAQLRSQSRDPLRVTNTKCLTLFSGGCCWGWPCQTRPQASSSSRRSSSSGHPLAPHRLR